MKLLSWLRRKTSDPQRPILAERKLSYQCAIVQGVGARENQEDSWSLVNASDVTKIRNEGILAVVADGMGGMDRGELASRTGIAVIAEDFTAMDRSCLAEQLQQSVLRASDAVYQALQGAGGSTVIACILYDEQLYYAGLGDSFLYLLRNGKLIKVSREQNLRHQHYLRCIRGGSVDASVHALIPQSGAVTDFLGIDRADDVDWLRRSLPLQDEDVLLLCSDGVSGALSQEELLLCLNQSDTNIAAEMLKNAILQKNHMNQDNFTAILIACKK